MKLSRALRVNAPVKAAFVGAGGKTTTIFTLARQLPGPVFVTTTTHISSEQAQLGDRHIYLLPGEPVVGELRIATKMQENVVVLTGPGAERETGRQGGLTADQLEGLRRYAEQAGDSLLIEADGAKMKAIKAPAAYEPVVPEWVDRVVVLAGLSALGKPLNDQVAHRPERLAQVTGLDMGDTITLETVIQMLSHPKGGLKDLPTSARKTAFLNQNEPGRINSEDLAALRSLLEKYDSVLIGQVVTQDEEDQIAWCLEPIAGIILAAGGSRRFGRSKQLLTYDGKPMVRRVAETALKSGLDPVVLVTGEDHERVLEAVFDLPVQIVNNPDWRSGVSTSIQAGLRVLPERSAGAVFLLADQPQIPAELIDRLLQSHASNQADITAPYVGERRGNPVLFDRRLFAELNELHGDVGGRALFDRHPVHPVYWEDDSILADIDTPEDYDQFIKGRHEH